MQRDIQETTVNKNTSPFGDCVLDSLAYIKREEDIKKAKLRELKDQLIELGFTMPIKASPTEIKDNKREVDEDKRNDLINEMAVAILCLGYKCDIRFAITAEYLEEVMPHDFAKAKQQAEVALEVIEAYQGQPESYIRPDILTERRREEEDCKPKKQTLLEFANYHYVIGARGEGFSHLLSIISIYLEQQNGRT